MATGSKGARKGSNPNNTFDAIHQGTGQLITTSATSSQSVALGSATTIVRVTATQSAYIEIGSNPTAVSSTSIYLPAGIVEYFGVTPGHKIAALQETTAGIVYITEGASV